MVGLACCNHLYFLSPLLNSIHFQLIRSHSDGSLRCSIRLLVPLCCSHPVVTIAS